LIIRGIETITDLLAPETIIRPIVRSITAKNRKFFKGSGRAGFLTGLPADFFLSCREDAGFFFRVLTFSLTGGVTDFENRENSSDPFRINELSFQVRGSAIHMAASKTTLTVKKYTKRWNRMVTRSITTDQTNRRTCGISLFLTP
jgi:hypothetical protein